MSTFSSTHVGELCSLACQLTASALGPCRLQCEGLASLATPGLASALPGTWPPYLVLNCCLSLFTHIFCPIVLIYTCEGVKIIKVA